MRIIGDNPLQALNRVRKHLLLNGSVIQTNTWQDMEGPPPMLEFINLSAIFPMADRLSKASLFCMCDREWAFEHFEERVSGEPYNPPPSHTKWQKQGSAAEHMSRQDPSKYSHTYPERLWPKSIMPSGIRFNPGDLHDAVELLANNPTTRQCYVPIWFPEDLNAATQGERVPCTLGYHFMVRNNKIQCFYPIRSCDAVRHLHNDFFFANALTLWIRKQVGLDSEGIEIGNMHFVCSSMHCFENDRWTLEQLVKKGEEKLEDYKDTF